MNKLHLLPILIIAGCLSRGDDSEIEDLTLDDDPRALGAKVHDDDDPASVITAEFHQPFRAAIDASVGRTAADIVRAASVAKVDHTIECLHMAGYSPAIADIEPFFADGPLTMTTGLDAAIETVTAGRTDADRLGIPDPHLSACLIEADERINPELALAELLGDATMEISRRVEADPELQAAFARQSACIARTGFDEGFVERYDDEELMASEITLGFLTGDISQADALEELEGLRAQREAHQAITHAVDRCVGQRLIVERALVAEQQRAYLEAHPGWAEEIAASYREILETLPE